MKTVLLALLLLGSTYGVPLRPEGMEEGSCDDPQAVSAAHLALSKINLARTEGYVLSLYRLANVHLARHGEVGTVFYLTLDVVDTNCSVLSRKEWKECEARDDQDQPMYGQCKATIYISKPHRVVRLYKYDCAIRPVPSAKVTEVCPDCPTMIDHSNENVQKAVSQSLLKFNNENNLNNHFAVRTVMRATAGMAAKMYYNVEYTIRETTCNKTQSAENCPLMTCEFAHNGFCTASLYTSPTDEQTVTVNCEIYESEAAEREKEQHLLGEKTGHSHNDSHMHEHSHEHDEDHDHSSHGGHGKGKEQGKGHEKGKHEGHSHGHGRGHGRVMGRNQTHPHGQRQTPHDHIHDHTKDHSHHTVPHPDAAHHHTHDHKAGSAYRHAHAHSHDHGLDEDHDHVHAHHAQAHDHSIGFPNTHHKYNHPAGTYTHEHDHEMALDHDHKHPHLHEHEHHHHHHEHVHETEPHDEPEGMVRILPAMDQPMVLPAFPDVPAGGAEVGVILPAKPDPQIPGQTEPTLLPFPITKSAQCVTLSARNTLVEKQFIEDPEFKFFEMKPPA